MARVGDIRERLLDALAAGEDVEVDLSGVTALDVSLGQILLALGKALADRGRNLRFHGNLPEDLSHRACWSGIDRPCAVML